MLTIFSKNTPFSDELVRGAVVLLDKPAAWTSFDVVNKVRYALTRRTGDKKLKIGHAGTLDPLATGLLVLCVGPYTKKIGDFQAMSKTYTGTFTFGATTPSSDLEKAVDATFPTKHLTLADIQNAGKQFTGYIQQIPPVFSAVKVDGRRVYKNARTGEAVSVPERTVFIGSFELDNLRPVQVTREQPVLANARGAPIMLHPDYPEGLQIDFRVVCGKGTYIRSLAFDLGHALGSGAYLSSLRRTHTGGFSVEDAWTIDDLIRYIREE